MYPAAPHMLYHANHHGPSMALALRLRGGATDGTPMVCEILVALQGRVDAARLFGQRLEQILFKLGARRSTWDPF